MSSGTPSGILDMLAWASFTWKYSAKTPSLMFENFQPPSGAPDCDAWPAWAAGSPQSGVIAPTSTRSPGRMTSTALPTSETTPTASWPSVRSVRGPMPPATVWESEVQMRAAVVFTIASFGPGLGTGLSIIATAPMPFITNAFIAFAPSELCVEVCRDLEIDRLADDCARPAMGRPGNEHRDDMVARA